MPSLNANYTNALLADAAYVDGLLPGISADNLVDLLRTRMTAPQAQFIAANFEVLANPTTGGSVVTSGFDATVWRGRAGTDYAGKVYVSFRGTAGAADWLTNIDLATNGAARAQYMDMINWWLKASTPAGQTARQVSLALGGAGLYFAAAPTIIATGELAGITHVEVNGHSLGGHLASAFSRLFGANITVDHITTFNSAGFRASSDAILRQIEALIGTGTGVFPGANQQSNMFAANGVNFTTNTFWFSQIGQRVDVFNEDGTGDANHSMYRLTDALALANTMARLDPTLTIVRANSLIAAGANRTEASLEGVVNGLRRLLLNPLAGDIPVGDANEDASTRVTYHEMLQQLQESSAFRYIANQVRIENSHDASTARNDFAALLSLTTGAPFSLRLNDPAPASTASLALYGVHPAAYEGWLLDRNALASGADALSLTYTDSYLNDRATWANAVAAKHTRDEAYTAASYGDGLDPVSSYQDVATGIVASSAAFGAPNVAQIVFGSEGADSGISGGTVGDRLYGGGGNDNLSGQGGADWLEGNRGDDTLDGGADNDTLLGGAGIDTYNFSGDFGRDMVLDADGFGSLQWSGAALPQGLRVFDGLWQSANRQVTYTQVTNAAADPNDPASARHDLVVSFAGGANRIVIRGWNASSRNLGITFGGDFSLPATTQNYIGDFTKRIIEVNGVQRYEMLGSNYVADVSAGPNPGAKDLITGQFGPEAIYGLGGNDAILGREGDDFIDGGDGSDILQGGLGQDRIIGGDGRDVIYGSSQGDLAPPDRVDFTPPQALYPNVWARGFNWLLEGDVDSEGMDRGILSYPPYRDDGIGDGSNFIDAGAGADWVNAGQADDIVQLGDGADQAYGMAGADVIAGGRDNDRIYGDGPVGPAGPLVIDAPGAQHGADVLLGDGGNDTLIGQGNDDILFGGADNDLLYGDDRVTADTPVEFHGADLMFGGTGNDTLIGGAKGDDLQGEAGNDSLWGDSGGASPGYTNFFDYAHHGDDTLQGGAGQDTLVGEGGSDSLFGGADNDVLFGDDDLSRLPAANHGADYLDGGLGDDILYGGEGNDTLIGGDGSDALYGDGGNDLLIGGMRGDFLSGGAGDDTYRIASDEAADFLAADSITDNSGNDLVELLGMRLDSIQVTRSGSTVALTWAAGKTIFVGNAATSSIRTVVAGGESISFKQLLGRRLQSAVSATSSQVGGTLLGGATADALTVVHANSTVYGGWGNDVINVNSAAGGVVQMSSGDGMDRVVAVRRDPPVLPGGLVPQNILELDADLNGADVRLYKTGVRSYVLSLNGQGDGVQFDADPGTSSVIAPGAEPFDAIRLHDGSVLTWQQILDRGVVTLPTATEGDDVLVLSPIGDIAYGLGGNDRLEGLAGNDVLYGNAGNDTLIGGLGNDTLLGGSNVNLLIGGDGDDELHGGGPVSYDFFEGGEGNDRYVYSFGHSGYDSGIGGRATDSSLTSNDTYRIRDVGTVGGYYTQQWVVNDGGGSDQLVFDSVLLTPTNTLVRSTGTGFSLSTYNLTVTIEAALTEGGALGAGAIESVTFRNGVVWTHDQLRSLSQQTTSGNDSVMGFGSNDYIDGGAGNDTLDGYSGNDTLLGSAGADVLRGGAGQDWLRGGAGYDQLSGGVGDDTLEAGPDGAYLYGGVGNDIFVVRPGDGGVNIGSQFGGEDQGFDVLQIDANPTSVALSIDRWENNTNSADVLRIQWLDGSAIIAFGLYGDLSGQVDAVEEILFADGSRVNVAQFVKATLPVASAGNDFLELTSLDDTFSSADGNDIVYSRYGDDVIDGGTGDDALYGGYGNDTLLGGVGNDRLVGELGNDVLAGGVGDDTLIGGAGANTYVFNAGDGRDLVYGDQNGTNSLLLGTGLVTSDVGAVWLPGAGFQTDTGYYWQPASWQGHLRLTIGTPGDSVDVQVTATTYLRLNGIQSVTDAGGAAIDLSALIAAANVATSGDDILFNAGFVDSLAGGEGNDQIYGLAGVNTLDGQGGNDTLVGGDWIDVLIGGTGDDRISGNRGMDTVRYARGDGNDTVHGSIYDGQLELDFSTGIAPSDVTFVRNGLGLGVQILGGGSVEIQASTVYGSPAAFVRHLPTHVRFLDGTVWDRDQVIARLFEGTPGNDQIVGFDYRDDIITGGSGDDILEGRGGSDTLDGGAGDDTLFAAGGSNYSSGSTVETLIGGAGNDIMLSSYGQLTYRFESGFGNDTIRFAGRDSSMLARVVFGAGVSPADVIVSRTRDSLILSLSNADDTITIESFFASVSSSDLSVMEPVQQVEFTDGTQWIAADLVARVVSAVTQASDDFAGTDGSDVIDALGGHDVVRAAAGDDQIIGGAGDDELYGDSGSDTLAGGQGNDRLYGGDGVDDLRGGQGDDWLFGGPGADVVHFARGDGRDVVSDGQGDTIAFASDIAQSDISYSRSNSDLVISIAGTTDQVIVQSFMAYLGSPYQVDVRFSDGSVVAGSTIYNDVITITGTASADSITGTAEVDRLLGLAGNDTLVGLGGNDLLDGGVGADVMQGGADDDTYWVDNVGDQVTEQFNAGWDFVHASITYTLPTNVEGLELLGTASINGTGNSAANELYGNDGSNVLNGGSGADYMAGGRGDDTYVVGSSGDQAYEDAAEGNDTVQSSVTYTLGDNIENLTLTNSSAVNGTGNDLNNTLTGNSGVNVLTGGRGDDTYVIGTGDSIVENVAEGIDTVQSSVTHTLGNHVENLTLTGSSAINGTGNTLSNVLTGNSGANVLTGGAGNDTYFVGTGDTVIEAAGGGIDSVHSGVTWTLSAEVENLTLTGTSAINGTGNASANVITGNSAANALNGGAGADTLIGGGGNDTYTVDNAGDAVIELAVEGTDLVSSNVTYTLSTNVENLTLTGTTAINGTGNASDNLLTGNSGNNTLTGGAGNDTLDGGPGNDTMVGGTGNDTYMVNVATDVVTEVANEGIDTVMSSVTLTLTSANVENLTLTGSSVINGTGNAVDNILIGNSANNTLTGGAGNDTLDGGLGNDTMVGGTGNDTFVVNATTDVVTELANEGIDTVQSSVALTLTSTNLENLTLLGTSALNGTGNANANILTGNSGNNVLSGLAGDDIYIGGAGNDTLTDNSTTSNDVYRWGVGQGNDTINDAGGSADRIEIGAGVTASQVTLTRSGNHLLVGVTGATDVLTVANWYVGTANRIEEIRLADGSVIGGGSAPLSMASPETPESRMFLLSEPAMPVVTAVDATLTNSAQSLVQAMAQFRVYEEVDTSWQARARYDPYPMLTATSL